jgi:UDP-N-acetylmuramate dehydrogenase
MVLHDNHSLKPYNTFGMDIKARRFVLLEQESDAALFLEKYFRPDEPMLIVGGGSNLLFTGDFPGTVMKVGIEGITLAEENGDHVIVKAGAGKLWDSFVDYCVDKGWSGVENLSLIPGNIGSGPIQNIGAYGAEISEVVHEVHGIRIPSGKPMRLSNKECRFGYRDSIFKHELKGKVIITSVTFKLHSPPHHLSTSPPELKLDYGTIRQELAAMGVTEPGISEVREAVCRIRTSKLPDPAVTGNAGSFFKNPVVSDEKAQTLRSEFPQIPEFPDVCGVKVPAAWLIEQCGWKGYRSGDAGVHPNQPLVLVNYGAATGRQILELSQNIQDSVTQKFGIRLEPEVIVV